LGAAIKNSPEVPVLAASTGFLTGLSLIIAIGAQNAFVLRQGLRREHVFAIVLFASVSDALLILVGIAGLGALIQGFPFALEAIRYLGAAYLIWFGVSALRRAIKPGFLEAGEQKAGSLKAALATTAALTFLNPHVYLDTVILLGGIGNQFGPDRWLFGAGAAISSFVWFFALGYFAQLLARFVSSPRFWRYLDGFVALVMFTIAILLLTYDF
jgi:L-lysine exporter family protein LysE/ArgO